jgi:hypothetical protein
MMGLIIPSHVKVLLYVRAGGRLEQPGGCSEQLHPADGSNNTHVYPGAPVRTGRWKAGAAWQLPERLHPADGSNNTLIRLGAAVRKGGWTAGAAWQLS